MEGIRGRNEQDDRIKGTWLCWKIMGLEEIIKIEKGETMGELNRVGI